MKENFIGKYCVVRGDRSGVFAGYVQSIDGQSVEMTDTRRLWYWSGAASISQIAKDGVRYPLDCKFTCSVNNIFITDVIEIIPTSENAKKCILEVPVWKF